MPKKSLDRYALTPDLAAKISYKSIEIDLGWFHPAAYTTDQMRRRILDRYPIDGRVLADDVCVLYDRGGTVGKMIDKWRNTAQRNDSEISFIIADLLQEDTGVYEMTVVAMNPEPVVRDLAQLFRAFGEDPERRERI